MTFSYSEISSSSENEWTWTMHINTDEISGTVRWMEKNQAAKASDYTTIYIKFKSVAFIMFKRRWLIVLSEAKKGLCN